MAMVKGHFIFVSCFCFLKSMLNNLGVNRNNNQLITREAVFCYATNVNKREAVPQTLIV